jgi:hypothetical protein
MSSLEISLITLLCLTGGVLLGMRLQHRLPGHHLAKESQDTVKLGAGMVATMSALVLGLLVSSAKASFDGVNVSIAQNGVRIIQLDRLLAEYGPETQVVRDQLKNALAGRLEVVWNKSATGESGLRAVEKSTSILELQASLRALLPPTDQQKKLISQSEQICDDIWSSRLLTIEEQQEPVPTVFLVLLVSWLTLLFLSFGLFAPGNFTVGAVLFICAVSVASAVFLILEMSHPLDGYIKVSSAPLVKALELIGH